MKNARTRLTALLGALILLAAAAPVAATGQLLAYQDGYVFFTTGDGFKVAPNVTVLDDATKQPTKQVPAPRDYARVVFNDAGEVSEIDLSSKALPVAAFPAQVKGYAVSVSSPYPNPDLAAAPATSANGVRRTFSGIPVLVKFYVQVPPQTPLDAQVYIATDVSNWNPEAIRMDRVDAMHFVAILRLASGTVLHYLYTRGSIQSEERSANGLAMKPREIVVNDSDTNTTDGVVATWADSNGSNLLNQPTVFPTPYNPAPFPNLPRGVRTPAPSAR